MDKLFKAFMLSVGAGVFAFVTFCIAAVKMNDSRR